jgi:hypothetical protein
MRGVRTGALLSTCVLASACGLVCAAGCTTPQTLTGSDPNHLLATVQVGNKVHAITRDDQAHEFKISAIDVGGVLRGVTTDGTAVAIPVADVKELEYRKFAPGRTAALAAGLVFGVGLLTVECEDNTDTYGYGSGSVYSCD